MDHNLRLLFRGTTRQAVVVFRPWIIGIEMKTETLSAWTLKNTTPLKPREVEPFMMVEVFYQILK